MIVFVLADVGAVHPRRESKLFLRYTGVQAGLAEFCPEPKLWQTACLFTKGNRATLPLSEGDASSEWPPSGNTATGIPNSTRSRMRDSSRGIMPRFPCVVVGYTDHCKLAFFECVVECTDDETEDGCVKSLARGQAVAGGG